MLYKGRGQIHLYNDRLDSSGTSSPYVTFIAALDNAIQAPELLP